VAQPGQFGRGRVAAGADDGDPPAAPRIGGCERRRGQLLRAAAEGFLPGVRYTTDDYVAVQRLVAAGLGRPPCRRRRSRHIATIAFARCRCRVPRGGWPWPCTGSRRNRRRPPALLARIRASVAR